MYLRVPNNPYTGRSCTSGGRAGTTGKGSAQSGRGSGGRPTRAWAARRRCWRTKQWSFCTAYWRCVGAEGSQFLVRSIRVSFVFLDETLGKRAKRSPRKTYPSARAKMPPLREAVHSNDVCTQSHSSRLTGTSRCSSTFYPRSVGSHPLPAVGDAQVEWTHASLVQAPATCN